MRIAMTTTTAFGNQHAFAGFSEIVNHLAGFVIVDDSTHRHRNREVFAVAAMPVAALAMTAAVGTKYMIKPEFQKCVFVRVRYEINAAAITAVTTAGSTFRDELFPTECNAPVTSVAGFDCDFGFVDEHG